MMWVWFASSQSWSSEATQKSGMTGLPRASASSSASLAAVSAL